MVPPRRPTAVVCVLAPYIEKPRFSHPPSDEALATAQPGESSRSCPVEWGRADTAHDAVWSLPGPVVESEHVLHTSGAVPEELIKSLMDAMRAGSFEKSEKVVDGIIKGGYPATQVRRFRSSVARFEPGSPRVLGSCASRRAGREHEGARIIGAYGPAPAGDERRKRRGGRECDAAAGVDVTLTARRGGVKQVLQQLLVAVLGATDTGAPAMARVCTRLAEADKKLADGADEYLQLLDCASCAICAFTGTSQLTTTPAVPA